MMPLKLSQPDKQRIEHYRKLIEQAASIDDIINELQKEALEFFKKRPGLFQTEKSMYWRRHYCMLFISYILTNNNDFIDNISDADKDNIYSQALKAKENKNDTAHFLLIFFYTYAEYKKTITSTEILNEKHTSLYSLFKHLLFYYYKTHLDFFEESHRCEPLDTLIFNITYYQYTFINVSPQKQRRTIEILMHTYNYINALQENPNNTQAYEIYTAQASALSFEKNKKDDIYAGCLIIVGGAITSTALTISLISTICPILFGLVASVGAILIIIGIFSLAMNKFDKNSNREETEQTKQYMINFADTFQKQIQDQQQELMGESAALSDDQTSVCSNVS